MESEREKAFSNQFITKLKEIGVALDVAKQKKNVDEQNVNESNDSKDKVQLAMQMESLFMILILKFIAQNSYYHYCLLQSGSYLMEVTAHYVGFATSTLQYSRLSFCQARAQTAKEGRIISFCIEGYFCNFQIFWKVLENFLGLGYFLFSIILVLK